ncbi:MAG: hypothetical protein U1F76_31350 [Candidatus Competibacteraceae bacterium]
MAETPRPILDFTGACLDCGQRRVTLPAPEPDLGDDFDWRARDYDAIRLGMLEELVARFPERLRWNPADLEVVLVEALAALLDQLFDMADRVTAEAYLETARRPESVRRLLQFIGYDAVRLADLQDDPETQPDGRTAVQKLERLWSEQPALMERSRREGPRAVHDQHRMVTLDDYTTRLEEHPIVMRAAARAQWTGSWMTLVVAVVLPWPGARLDAWPNDVLIVEQNRTRLNDRTRTAIERFHAERGVPLPPLTVEPPPTPRTVLQVYVDAYRMVGQEVVLLDAEPVGIALELVVTVAATYFQSEVRRAVMDALGTQPGGFFAPGRLRFGEDLHASDIFQALLRLEGVENVCLSLFKRVGAQYYDLSATGLIALQGLEIAVCDNDPAHPERGYLRLSFYGGLRG